MPTRRGSPPSSPTPSASTSDGPRGPRAGSGFWTVFDPSVASFAGVHRVQRVPATEKRGRRHSSLVTVVAIDPDAFTSDAALDTAQVRVDTFRGSGPGGQHRNKTDSAVRLTHLPSGVVVTATEARSQHENRRVAWGRLRSALEQRSSTSQHAVVNEARADAFGQRRDWTWTGWRDQVKGPGRITASMSRALRGDLRALLR